MPMIVAQTEERFDYGLPSYLESPMVNFLSALGITGAAGLSTVNSASAATANTAAINTALAGSGYVSISAPGRYYINSTIFIPSNTEFSLAKGVELFLANGTSAALLANKNAFTAGTAIGSALVWAGGTGDAPKYGMQLNKTGIGAQFPVGSFIGIMGLTSSRNDQAFQGVWQVTISSANQIVFNIDSQPPNGGNSSAGGSYWPADNNITISGGGILNGNQAGQAFNATVQFAGDPRSCLTWFRNVKDLIVSDLSIKRSLSWGISSNNCVDYTVRNIHIDVYDGLGILITDDPIHFAGGHRRVLVQNIFARAADNVIGFTIDKASTVVNSYSQFYAPGDTHSVVIKDIYVSDGSTAAMIGIWGPTDYFHNSIVIDGVHGKGSGSIVSMFAYVPTAMDGVTGGTLDIRNITVVSGAAPIVDLSGDGTWDLISIDGVKQSGALASPVVNIAQGTTAQTIKQLRVSRCTTMLSNGVGRSNPVMLIGNANIQALDIVDCRAVPLQVNINMVNITGSGATTIGQVTFTNCTVRADASGTSALLSVTGATPVSSISFNNCHLAGLGGTGFMLNLGASAVVSAAFFSSSTFLTAAGLLTAAGNIGRLNGPNVQFDGAKITGTPLPGDTFYNTNAAFGVPGTGVYTRGTATWTRVAI